MTEQGCTITHGGPELPPESITDDTETEYDYKYLCMPRNPWSKTKQKPLRFYGKDEAISSPLALLMGLQHAFAMIGGLITPPLVIFRYSIDFQDTELQQYAVAAALITSGITSLINIFQFPIPFSEKIFGRKLFLGSGVLSVLGTSFTFVPIFDIAISDMMNDGVDGRTAYGRMLGTAMVCSLIEIIFSLAPPGK